MPSPAPARLWGWQLVGKWGSRAGGKRSRSPPLTPEGAAASPSPPPLLLSMMLNCKDCWIWGGGDEQENAHTRGNTERGKTPS